MIHDSRTAEPLVGVRGHEPLPDGAWTNVFTAPSADLIIDGTPLGDGHTSLRGHLLFRDGMQVSFSVSSEHETSLRSDQSGRFELGSVEPGKYNFAITSEGFRLPFQVEVTR